MVALISRQLSRIQVLSLSSLTKSCDCVAQLSFPFTSPCGTNFGSNAITIAREHFSFFFHFIPPDNPDVFLGKRRNFKKAIKKIEALAVFIRSSTTASHFISNLINVNTSQLNIQLLYRNVVMLIMSALTDTMKVISAYKGAVHDTGL